MQDRAPEFLDLLGMIVKVVGTNLTLKRNQAYVMKYIMQNYKKVAFVLDMSREDRYWTYKICKLEINSVIVKSVVFLNIMAVIAWKVFLK